MTGAPPGAAWQSDDLAASFLDRRQILVPLLDVQEDLIRRLLVRRAQPIGRREAGFEQAEVHFKWAEAAVFGAAKPSGGEH